MQSTKSPPICIVCADASPSIGGGHVMRCITLAGELHQQGWAIGFAATPETRQTVADILPDWLEHFPLSAGDETNPASLRLFAPNGCNLLLIDNYKLDVKYEGKLRGWAESIAVIDDLANRSHDCDVIVDQTPDRSAADYTKLVPPTCSILCGNDYMLLRSEFARRRLSGLRTPEDRFPPRRIVVFMGLGDPDCLSLLALKAITESQLNAEVRVFLGNSSPTVAGVLKYAAANSAVKAYINAQNMSGHLDWADLAIGTAGTSSWERCCLALPTIALTITDREHDNQRATSEALSRHGGSLNLGEGTKTSTTALVDALRKLASDSEYFKSMSISAANLCDGLGAPRVAMHLAPTKCRGGTPLSLRPLSSHDADRVYSWQSAPGVRSYFRDPRAPSPAQHAAWVAERLSSTSIVTEIILLDGEPARIVRLDPLKEEEFEVWS